MEKPAVLQTKHAEILAKLCNKKKVRCWVAFQNRYNLAVSKLKKDVLNKRIGKVNLVDSSLFGLEMKLIIKLIGEETIKPMVVF